MNSIRKRLLFSILSVLILATIAVGIATYIGIRHEMDELYDANMQQLAVTASGMMADENIAQNAAAFSQEWPKGEQIFLIQIWKDAKILYSSHPVAAFPLQGQQGFGRAFFESQKWVYYQEEIDGKIIQVSQELHERRDVIREVYNAIIIPILIQFPLVSLLVWLLVSYGFQPLTRISDLIQKRTAYFMEPISLDNTPDEVRVLVIALNDLLARLEEAFKVHRQFTADAAHELRTPLTAVRLQLDLLGRAKTEDEKKDAIDMLDRGVSRSIHLVHQLLELARQEPDHVVHTKDNVNLAMIAKMTADEQKAAADLKSITLHLDLHVSSIQGDASALTIMAGNLLSNAIAYTNQGGNVMIRTYAKDDTAILEISDDGIGIAQEHKDRVFDRFYRILGTDITGSGLGLSIVNTIAGQHGAEIVISDGIHGKGTTFRIIFRALSLT